VSESRYVIRPKADRDLEDQAYYYATVATPELGHRFLLAAHETFSLLATQPNMGWQARLKVAALERMRVFRVKGFERILILYIPLLDGAEILRVVHGSRNLESFLQREGLD
jgi:toxin ParE1/3/4